MSMEFYDLVDKSNFLGKIDSINIIEKELILFESKTGILIDEYGTTRLYLDNIKLLYKLIENKPNEISKILKTAIDSQIGILIEGD